METEEILEPLSEYQNRLREKSIDEANKYFDELVEQAKLDQDENSRTANKFYLQEKDFEAAKQKADNIKGVKILLIVLAVILFIAAVFMFVLGILPEEKNILLIVLGPIALILGIAIIVIIKKKLNKIIQKREELANKLLELANQTKELCFSQMAMLNSIYDWSDTAKIVKRVTPLLQLDDKFDDSKYLYLKRKYGIDTETSKESSNYFVLSGSIVGNPFLVERLHNENMIDKVYEGTLLITWTTTETDSKGNTRTVSHSQTLVATVTKPCPEYSFETFLVYGNDAAERLSFSREPQVNASASEKAIQKQVKRVSKKLDKIAEKAVTDNDPTTNFTKMGNDEFDSLFHAIDRDDETQFRLLFTPLAQTNMLKLIKSKAPFGDDFTFIKKKQLNYIFSNHAQNQNIYSNPNDYVDFDVRKARKKFVDYNFAFFRSLYFDLAPILSIPLYQQTKSVETIYGTDEPNMNVSPFEQESLANAFAPSEVDPEGAATKAIRKTTYLGSEGGIDKVKITSYAFKGTPMVDYVTKMGGDGCFHQVPVHWVQYDPLQRVTFMGIQNYNDSRYNFNRLYENDGFRNAVKLLSSKGIHFERRLLAFIVPSNGKDVPSFEAFKKVFETKDSNANQ